MCSSDLDLCGDSNKVLSIAADLSSMEGVALIIERIKSEGLEITHLVNNAGYTKPAPIYEVEMSDFRRTLEVNLITPFLLIKELLALCSDLKVIVNIASTAGINGRAGWSAYSASKAAIIALSESLREELSINGINVVCLSPGRCATDLRRELAPEEDPTTIMQPEQVAKVIMLYLSEMGRLIDSENIVVRT